MNKNGWEDFSLVFKTDFLINAQEINYNLNIVDTALRSCSDGFIRFMKVKDIVALASRNLKKRKYPLLMTKYIQIYLDFKKKLKKGEKKTLSNDKGKRRKELFLFPLASDSILGFGKLDFNYCREMTLDPKRSGHI